MLAICLVLVVLYFLLYGWSRWHVYRIRQEMRSAGPVAWTGSLQSLYVSGTDEQAMPALEVMIRHRIPLVLHFFPESKITDRSLRVVGRMTWLRELYLAEHNITDEGLKHLENLDELTYLVLNGTLVTDQGIQSLASLDSLRRLSVGRTMVTAHGLKQLVDRVPRLQSQWMDQQIAALRKKIFVEGDDQTAGPLLQHLIELRSPTHRLDLSGPGLTDRSLELVGQMTWLRELSIANAEITGKGFRLLVNLQQLEKLSLYRTSVTAQGLEALTPLSALRALSLRKAEITDKELRVLAKLEQLEELSLKETKVTDEGILALAPLPALRRLWVSGTEVSAEGLAELMSNNPSLQNRDMREYVEFLKQHE